MPSFVAQVARASTVLRSPLDKYRIPVFCCRKMPIRRIIYRTNNAKNTQHTQTGLDDFSDVIFSITRGERIRREMGLRDNLGETFPKLPFFFVCLVDILTFSKIGAEKNPTGCAILRVIRTYLVRYMYLVSPPEIHLALSMLLCYCSSYAISTRRHPAHPVSAPIFRRGETQALRSQSHDTDILFSNNTL